MLLGSTRLDRDDDFLTFAADARGALLRVATLLHAGDPLRAEAAVRTALTRGYLAWPVTGRPDAPAHALRVLVDRVRREGRHTPHRALVGPALPLPAAAALTALATLPVRPRAAVVLRRVERLTAAAAADALGCAELTAAQEAAAGAARLRAELADLLPTGRRGAGLDDVLRETAAWLEQPPPDAAVLAGDLDRGHRALVRARRAPAPRAAVPS